MNTLSEVMDLCENCGKYQLPPNGFCKNCGWALLSTYANGIKVMNNADLAKLSAYYMQTEVNWPIAGALNELIKQRLDLVKALAIIKFYAGDIGCKEKYCGDKAREFLKELLGD